MYPRSDMNVLYAWVQFAAFLLAVVGPIVLGVYLYTNARNIREAEDKRIDAALEHEKRMRDPEKKFRPN